VQAALKQWDEEISRLNGELTQLSVSHEDLRQSLEEQEATVLSLRQAAEDAREALEVEKKQVEGELLLAYVSERTLMSPRGGVNRRDNQIKLFPPKHLS
jgi:predicted  nucleic acid-binding Zn-ribbon protein